MKKPVIGILTYRKGLKFEEPEYFRGLVKEGKKLGATVYLFSIWDVSLNRKQIRGVVPSVKGGWHSRWFPWPDVVIDRCRKRHKGYFAFRKKPLFLYANSVFDIKWNVYRLLSQDERVRNWLPPTFLYSVPRLKEMLRQHPLVYVKPANGTGGRGILKITTTQGGYILNGKSNQRLQKTVQITHPAVLVNWVNHWVKTQRLRNGKFLVQKGINLELMPERVADLRLLIQKNGQGEWSITGIGARVGGRNSPTSNLHGGGRAMIPERVLTPRFGEERTTEILQECCQLALLTAQTLEEHYGRMLEFGLDIGVDVQGNIWLIEVNPKPGREIFKQSKQMSLYRESVRKPLEYALYLLTENGKNPDLLQTEETEGDAAADAGQSTA